ncbi:MAG: HesB/IscA family protein [Gammaproteobacteria bacterium]
MITVSTRAAEQIRQSAGETDARGMGLRIAAKRRPDGSIEYAMGFDEPGDNDNRVSAHDVEILVAPASADLLQGMTLDYVELNPGEFGFIFMNPNDPAYVPPTED